MAGDKVTMTEKRKLPPWTKWLGIGLVGLSGILFGGVLLVPFTPLSLEAKAILGLLFMILMEASFWIGALILGKQAFSRFRKWLRPRSQLRGRRSS